jgi:SprT-like family protein
MTSQGTDLCKRQAVANLLRERERIIRISMLHLGEMGAETAADPAPQMPELLQNTPSASFKPGAKGSHSPETLEQLYARVFRVIRPRASLPRIAVRFRTYANANSRIRLHDGILAVDISDLLQSAPDTVQEALAHILLGKLFRSRADSKIVARYRRYLNRSDVRRSLHLIKRVRGRKFILDPKGEVYDLCELFEELNSTYFAGLMARPSLGWSVKTSRTVLGHYDPSHHAIVLNSLLDSSHAPALAVRYVMFHEMLHLRFPAEHRGSRRCVHTRAFKEAEKRLEDFQTAKAQLKLFVERVAEQPISNSAF